MEQGYDFDLLMRRERNDLRSSELIETLALPSPDNGRALRDLFE
jgi:hypothetical protein